MHKRSTRVCPKHMQAVRAGLQGLLTACHWLPFSPVDHAMASCRVAPVAGAVEVVCHGQVCGGVRDSQPPEERLISNHPRLILRLSILVACTSPSVILLFLSVGITLIVTVVVISVVITSFVAIVIAAVVATVIATVVTVIVTVVVAVTPLILLWLCVAPVSPVFLWLLMVASAPLCHIKTVLLIPARNYSDDGLFHLNAATGGGRRRESENLGNTRVKQGNKDRTEGES